MHEARWLETVVEGTLGVSGREVVIVERDQAHVPPQSLAGGVPPGMSVTRYHFIVWSLGGPNGAGLYSVQVVLAVLPEQGHPVLIQRAPPRVQLLIAAPTL